MFFTVEKIEKQLKEIRKAIHREAHDFPLFRFLEGDPPGAECPEFDDRSWSDFRIGDFWGGYDVVAWFRAWLAIPQHLKDKKLALRFQVGPRDGGGSTAESLLYVNGIPLQAIDIWQEEAWLPPDLLGQGKYW